MDWVPINWGLIKNPLNWITIILMVIIAGFAAQQAVRLFQAQGVKTNG